MSVQIANNQNRLLGGLQSTTSSRRQLGRTGKQKSMHLYEFKAIDG